ncbi:MAG: penicillin-binding protein activator, partial [Endozoicomonas sp.]
MTTCTSPHGRLPALAFLTIATLLMAACSSGPSIKTSQSPPPSQHQSIDQRLILAARTHYPERARLTLDITKELLSSSPEQVKTLLDEMPYDELPRDIQAHLAVQQATIAQIHKKNWEVFEWLDREPVISSNAPEIIEQSHILKALSYSHFGEFKAALDEWLLASPLLSKKQKTTYYDSFWQTLLHAPRTTLESLYNRETSSSLQGWLNLAIIYQSENPLDQQLASLQQWRSQWPGHPAAAYLPDNFDSIRASALQKPRKIAILLPLSGGLGKAGRSVQDGIITAHYETAINSQDPQPELQFYNTH